MGISITLDPAFVKSKLDVKLSEVKSAAEAGTAASGASAPAKMLVIGGVDGGVVRPIKVTTDGKVFCMFV